LYIRIDLNHDYVGKNRQRFAKSKRRKRK